MNLNPEIDLEINADDLTGEFKRLSLTLYRYYVAKAEAEREYDAAKAAYEDLKARVYKELRSSGEKKTEKTLEAEVDTNDTVQSVLRIMLDAKRDLATAIGAVESMKAKKDMLIQLGADARKDL